MRAWPWLVLLAASCGDNLPDATDGARSGSRLRIAWFDFDGTRQWQPEEGRHFADGRLVNSETFYDQLREEPCAPEPWLDGITRCTPEVELITRKIFADAQCTTRVTENPNLYKYVGDYDDKCGLRRMWHVFPVVSTMPRTELYYIASDGKCWPAPSSAPELGVLGAELMPTAFVTVETASAPNGDRSQVRSHEAEDGMQLPLGFNDALLGPSDVAYFEGKSYALPTAAVSASADTLFYADPACTRAYIRIEPGCGAPPSAIGDTAYYAIGGRPTATPLYARTFGACTQLATTPDGDFYEVLVARPLETIALTIRASEDAGRRIQLQHASSQDAVVRLRELFDTELGAECVPRKFPDDVYRCAPDQAAAELQGGMFADATCTMALELVHGLPPHRPPRMVLQDRTLLGGALKIFEVGEPYSEPLYSLGGSTGDTCVPRLATDLYHLGDVVDWSVLATATLATE